MIWAFIAGAVGLIVGYGMACIATAGKHSDLLSANEYLRQEVQRWRKEFENLKELVIKHVR